MKRIINLLVKIFQFLNIYGKYILLTSGVLHGSYYDSKGRPTAKLEDYHRLLEEAQAWQASQKAETERYPPCNSEWSQGKGGRIWCTNKRYKKRVYPKEQRENSFNFLIKSNLESK